MMNVFVTLPGFPHMRIEGSAEECALFVLTLSSKKGGAGSSATSAGKDQALPVESLGCRPPEREEVQKPPAPPPRRPAVRQAVSPRRSQGGGSRRAQVLSAFEALKQEGLDVVDLGQIEEKVKILNPGIEVKHLDQVIRDLANKTGLIKRAGRGKFRLPT